MGCCDGWELDVEEDDVEGECPDCCEPTVNGSAKTGCNHSPVCCKTCGSAPCDESC